MSNDKKYGGFISDWTIHNFDVSDEVKQLYENSGVKPQIMTGVVKEDPLGRWEIGWEMKSSLIVNVDRENGIVETMNTIYKVDLDSEHPENDLGNLAASIYF